MEQNGFWFVAAASHESIDYTTISIIKSSISHSLSIVIHDSRVESEPCLFIQTQKCNTGFALNKTESEIETETWKYVWRMGKEGNRFNSHHLSISSSIHLSDKCQIYALTLSFKSLLRRSGIRLRLYGAVNINDSIAMWILHWIAYILADEWPLDEYISLRE